MNESPMPVDYDFKSPSKDLPDKNTILSCAHACADQQSDFKQIIEYVPNDFAVSTVVKLHSVNCVVTQYQCKEAIESQSPRDD